MTFDQVLFNILLMILCYVYILIIIVISGRMDKFFTISTKTSRKFLHAMIGNLCFIIPFFTLKIFPTFVAAPFILITFLATSYSPFKTVSKKLERLSGLTEEGHQLGLVLYAISYTGLALVTAFFDLNPITIAAGVLPMAYGDAAASMIGQKYGRHRYKLVAWKSLEGSAAMYLASLVALVVTLVFFFIVYRFSFLDKVLAVVAASTVATVAEGFSPMGLDNLTVPALGALTFLSAGGGV